MLEYRLICDGGCEREITSKLGLESLLVTAITQGWRSEQQRALHVWYCRECRRERAQAGILRMCAVVGQVKG